MTYPYNYNIDTERTYVSVDMIKRYFHGEKYASFFNPLHITPDSMCLASWGGYNVKVWASNALVDNYHGTSMQTLTSKGNINKYIENRSSTTLFVSLLIPSTLRSNDCSGRPKTSNVGNLEHICNEASWYCNITNQRDRNRRIPTVYQPYLVVL